jgi:outer membrane receptor protein involved in Fe transport
MIRKILFILMFPVCLFSQDTVTWSLNLPEFTVKSVGKKESSAAVINMIKNNVVVSDGLSSEFVKRTPDRNVSDALKRINGVTIQNDRFVLVRGLSDRYNLAMLNKTLLPSTEPDRKSFSFDVIPSNMIDNLVIVKSAMPSLPGDFGGGIVQVTTKEVSDNFMNVGLSSSYGFISTGQPFKLISPNYFPSNFPSTYKFRVGSLGDRRAYSSLIADGKTKEFTTIPNLGGNVAYGYEKGNWYFLLSGSARENYALNYIDRQDYQSSTELAYKYKDTMYSRVSTLNGLVNITYYDKHKFSLKSLFNRQIENTYLTRNGENYDNIQDVRSTSSNTIEKTILNTQFDVKFGNTEFVVGHNLMLRDQPDYRVNPIVRSLGADDKFSIAWRDTYRFWSVMNENSLNGTINHTYKDFKVGGLYIKRTRNFKARVFRYDAPDLLNEITNNTDRYSTDFDLMAGYAQYDKEFGKFKVNGGLRVEYNLFDVATSDFSGEKINVEREYLDFLPSFNLSYNLEKIKVRASSSKTLVRPEFREVANFAYYDFVRNAQILGNSSLEKSDIYNFDLKFEYYPKFGENISVALFGKKFIKPIEQIVADGSVPSNLLLTYTNPDDAVLYGIELEFRKKLNSSFDVYTNATLSSSKVVVNGISRSLQGQSGYILNGGINYKLNDNVFSVSYNRVGDRISAVGFQGYPDIYENSRDVFDFVYLRKFNMFEAKLSINDILAQPSKYYQKVNQRDLINTNNEQTVSLSLNVKL